MLNLKLKTLYYYVILPFLFCLISSIITNAAEQKTDNKYASYKNKGPLSKTDRLLEVLKWDKLYEVERKKDITYLFGNIEGEELNGLTAEQKKEVIVLMQNIAIEQMTKSKPLIRGLLSSNYNQFFTPDELNKLIQYFNTELMQMIINSRINNTAFTTKEIQDQILSGKASDKQIISSMGNSYLHVRYSRFQEKISPLVKKIIVDQLKISLSYALEQIPTLIKTIKNNDSAI